VIHPVFNRKLRCILIDDSYRLARHGDHSFLVEQQPTIWIHTRSQADQVLVEIVDNGIGIPLEVQPHIFEPFFTTKEWVREQGLDSIPVTKSLNGMGEIFASWLDPVILVSRFGFLVNPIRMQNQEEQNCSES